MIEPFLKWPGGKRWLVAKYPNLFPTTMRRYIEPFLGSGAVYFHLTPKRALLADANLELVRAYNAIKSHPAELDRMLQRFQKRHNPAFYYQTRKLVPDDELKCAARFLYLNRTCFNGIYRVNLNGTFNVPIGSKTKVAYPAGYLDTVATALQPAKIVVADFEATISRAASGDFVYIDPPYTVMHNNNNFVKYNDVLFSWNDQERLADAVRQAMRRGAMVLVSNADHASVRKLYRGIGRQHVVSRSSVLAASSASRRFTTELAIENYT